mmetsp:Transcript_54529/g.100915  ORF Transcript_54529/g.100915 Transcript_54529/m.100915 type:complete len:637 (+) Transcript_54529:70-1980(+)
MKAQIEDLISAFLPSRMPVLVRCVSVKKRNIQVLSFVEQPPFLEDGGTAHICSWYSRTMYWLEIYVFMVLAAALVLGIAWSLIRGIRLYVANHPIETVESEAESQTLFPAYETRTDETRRSDYISARFISVILFQHGVCIAFVVSANVMGHTALAVTDLTGLPYELFALWVSYRLIFSVVQGILCTLFAPVQALRTQPCPVPTLIMVICPGLSRQHDNLMDHWFVGMCVCKFIQSQQILAAVLAVLSEVVIILVHALAFWPYLPRQDPEWVSAFQALRAYLRVAPDWQVTVEKFREQRHWHFHSPLRRWSDVGQNLQLALKLLFIQTSLLFVVVSLFVRCLRYFMTPKAPANVTHLTVEQSMSLYMYSSDPVKKCTRYLCSMLHVQTSNQDEQNLLRMLRRAFEEKKATDPDFKGKLRSCLQQLPTRLRMDVVLQIIASFSSFAPCRRNDAGQYQPSPFVGSDIMEVILESSWPGLTTFKEILQAALRGTYLQRLGAHRVAMAMYPQRAAPPDVRKTILTESRHLRRAYSRCCIEREHVVKSIMWHRPYATERERCEALEALEPLTGANELQDRVRENAELVKAELQWIPVRPTADPEAPIAQGVCDYVGGAARCFLRQTADFEWELPPPSPHFHD